MIEIKSYRGENNIWLTMNGHACFNPGNDIVCAAASMLSQTFLNALRAMEERGELTAFHAEDTKEGELYIKAEAGKHMEKVLILYDAFLPGFMALSESYPENVRLTLKCPVNSP